MKQDPRSGEACYRLGLANLNEGKDPREAYHWVSLEADLLPDNPEVKVILADLSGYMGDRN